MEINNITFFVLYLFSLGSFAQVHSIGAMSEMAKTGFSPVVKIDSILNQSHLYGLGPYGKMLGEITAIDGQAYAAYTNEDGELRVKTDQAAYSPFFVYTYVENWESVRIKASVNSPKEIEDLIQSKAKALGYSLTDAFPFRIKGVFDHLVLHVVSPRSADVPGYKEGVNSHKYEFDQKEGEILGFYSESAHGIYTPNSSNIHIHFISDNKKEMGHIDGITLSENKEIEILFPAKNRIGSNVQFKTIDTDFSKGRIGYEQKINLNDLEKFHGHLCDGLVVGALAIETAMKTLYPNEPIDRTNLRIVSKPSPCLTDVAIYLTGARYQFNTFYVDETIQPLFIIQRIDNGQAVSVSLKKGVKPGIIDEMGSKAINGQLSPCDLDILKTLEDKFTETLLIADAPNNFQVTVLSGFQWNPVLKSDFTKTDILNKNLPACK